jgi:putative membrane protein
MPSPTTLGDLVALPLAQLSDGAPRGGWYTHWYINPVLLVGVVAVVAAYVWFTGPWARRQPDPSRYVTLPRQRVSFGLAVVLLLVALGPPLEDWATWYLLTAHMVQHMLLTLFVPPLLLLGLPAWTLRPLVTRFRPVERAGYALTRMPVGLGLSALATLFWHLPPVMDVACDDPVLHGLERASYLVTYLLFWWAVVGPLPEWPRLSEPLQCLTLFLQMLPMILVGAPITLSGSLVYEHYEEHTFGLFSVDRLVDQQVGGALMWVIGMVGMLVPLTFIFLRWAGRQDAEARGGSAPRRATTPRGAGD